MIAFPSLPPSPVHQATCSCAPRALPWGKGEGSRIRSPRVEGGGDPEAGGRGVWGASRSGVGWVG